MNTSTFNFSIVIPAYNREVTIVQCLQSIVDQTYPHFEVLVVDDGSTDNTARIVREFPDSRVHLVCQKNQGAQAARNHGINQAKFEWIAFQDSDDIWYPTKLAKQLDVLTKFGFDPWMVIHANAEILHQDGTVCEMLIPHTHGWCHEVLLRRPAPFFQAMLVSKVALQKIGLLDEKVPSFQEWDTSIRLSAFCQFYHMNDVLFQWRHHTGDTISKDHIRDLKGHEYVVRKFESENRQLHFWQMHFRDLCLKSLVFGKGVNLVWCQEAYHPIWLAKLIHWLFGQTWVPKRFKKAVIILYPK